MGNRFSRPEPVVLPIEPAPSPVNTLPDYVVLSVEPEPDEIEITFGSN